MRGESRSERKVDLQFDLRDFSRDSGGKHGSPPAPRDWSFVRDRRRAPSHAPSPPHSPHCFRRIGTRPSWEGRTFLTRCCSSCSCLRPGKSASNPPESSPMDSDSGLSQETQLKERRQSMGRSIRVS